MRAILCLILFHCEFLSELLLIRSSATPHTCNCYYSTLAHLIPRACATILQIWYTYFFFPFTRSFFHYYLQCRRYSIFILSLSFKFAFTFRNRGCNNKSVRIYNVRRQSYSCICAFDWSLHVLFTLLFHSFYSACFVNFFLLCLQVSIDLNYFGCFIDTLCTSAIFYQRKSHLPNGLNVINNNNSKYETFSQFDRM